MPASRSPPLQLRFGLNHRHLTLTVNGCRADRSQPAVRFLLALINASWFRKGAPAVNLAEFDAIERQYGRSKLDHKAMSRVLSAVDGMGLGVAFVLATPRSKRTTGPWVLAHEASHWVVELNQARLDAITLAAVLNSGAAEPGRTDSEIDLAQIAQQLMHADSAFDQGDIVGSLAMYRVPQFDHAPLLRSLIRLREIKALRHLERKRDIKSLIAPIRAELCLTEQPLREYLLAQLKLVEIRNAYEFHDNPAVTVQNIESLAADTVVRTNPTLASQALTLLALSYRKLARRLEPIERRSMLEKALNASELAVTHALAVREAELQQNVFTNHGILISAVSLNEGLLPGARIQTGIQALHWVMLSRVVCARWQVGLDSMWDSTLLLGIAADHGVELRHLREHPLTADTADRVFERHTEFFSYAYAQMEELKRRLDQCTHTSDMPIQAAFLLIEIAWRSLLKPDRKLLKEVLTAIEVALGHAHSQDDQRESHLWCLYLALSVLSKYRKVLDATQSVIARGSWRIDVLKLIGQSVTRSPLSSSRIEGLCQLVEGLAATTPAPESQTA